MDNKIVDKIVWWIPLKIVRDFIRELFYKIIYISDKIDLLDDKVNLLATEDKLKSYNFISSYYVVNKVKELELKEKVKMGNKIRVLFFVNYSSKFGLESVYSSMIENEKLFDPYIFVCHPREELFNNNKIYKKEILETYEHFKELGYRIIMPYNLETEKSLFIEEYEPDIIFLNNPNMHQMSPFKNIKLNFDYLLCYVNYGMNVVNSYDYHYNNVNINTAWKNFVENKFTYKEHINNVNTKGLNVVLTGYPKLDYYNKPMVNCSIDKKIDNGKKIVIIAPHWTLGSDRLGTFDIYHNYFIELLKSNPNINFVFKPHPDLVYRIIDTKIMDYNYFMQYIEIWNNSSNGIYIHDGEYIDLFRKSSCLITDCGSFIGEYLPSKNPCIYLVNPKRKNFIENYFNDFGKKILTTYYLCYNQSDIKSYFDKVIINENDYLKSKRLKVLGDDFYDIGNAGKNIVSYLEKILRAEQSRAEQSRGIKYGYRKAA